MQRPASTDASNGQQAPRNASWNSPEGQSAVKSIVQARIPEWKDGLRPQQKEPILRILDGEDVMLCTATGDGKSALFTVPILCHQEVKKHPERYPNFRAREHAVGIVITPTKGLGRNIVDTLAKHNISALAYDHDTIVDAAHQHRNLVHEITSCKAYHLICIDPEHLNSHTWRKILDTTVFRDNIIFACLEEGHLAIEWGLTFRPSYRNIGSFIRGRLPSQISVFSISASLQPGAPTTALYKTLGFRAGKFKEFRYSNERLDLQFVLETLDVAISSRSFPQLIPYLNTGRKVIIYAPSLDCVTRIYNYLFRMPPGVDHSRCVRPYTALMDAKFNLETLKLMESDPALQVIIASVALANGVHCAGIDDSLSVGMPSTLSQTEQHGGRAVRLPGATGKAVVFVQKTDFKKAKDYLASVATGSHQTLAASHSRRAQKTIERMDPAKAELFIESTCLNAARNRIWQNPPIDDTDLTCAEAGRLLPCSLCMQREPRTVTFTSCPSVHPSFLEPPTISKPPPAMHALTLKKKERPLVEEALASFGDKVHVSEMYREGNEHRPPSWFLLPSLKQRLTDDLLRITIREELQLRLETEKWVFHTSIYVDELWKIIVTLRNSISKSREEEKAKRKPGRKKRLVKLPISDSEHSSGDAMGDSKVEEEDEPPGDAAIQPSLSLPPVPAPPAPAPPSPGPSARSQKRTLLSNVTNQRMTWRRTTAAPTPKQTMKELMADLGPPRTKNTRRVREDW